MISHEPILTFGKYAGAPLSQVAEDNPAYLFWLTNNTQLHNSLREQIEDQLSRIKFDPNAENRPFPICPRSGNGAVHAKWLLPAARWCREYGLSSRQALDKLYKRITRDPSPVNEIETAVAKVYNQDPLEPGERPKSKTVKLNFRLRAKVIADNPLTPEQLRTASPTNFDDNPNATEEIVDALFGPDNPWICAGISVDTFATRRRRSWFGHMHRMSLIVPNPMCAQFGHTQAGHLSEHTLDNVALPPKFIVVDQDDAPIFEQLPILRYLAQFLPLALIVFSGHESVHGWFNVQGVDQQLINKFFDRAESIGADHALRNPMQFVRVPSGRHKNGNLQQVLFFDPSALQQVVPNTSSTPPNETNPKTDPAQNPSSSPETDPHSAASEQSDTHQPTDSSQAADPITESSYSSMPAQHHVAPKSPLPLPPNLPKDVAAILATAPPFGNGLLQWIRLAALTLLSDREPHQVASYLHLVTKHYPDLTGAEILSLKRSP
jgi:hypothetical protein